MKTLSCLEKAKKFSRDIGQNKAILVTEESNFVGVWIRDTEESEVWEETEWRIRLIEIFRPGDLYEAIEFAVLYGRNGK